MPGELVMQYTKNRIELKKVKDEISKLITTTNSLGLCEFNNIDLSEYRASWLEDYSWNGWVVAVTNHPDIEPTHEEYKLANLLDEKARIRRECGLIRLKIYGKGLSMINAENREKENA